MLFFIDASFFPNAFKYYAKHRASEKTGREKQVRCAFEFSLDSVELASLIIMDG